MESLLLFSLIFQMGKVRPEPWNLWAKACTAGPEQSQDLNPRLSEPNDRAPWCQARSSHLSQDGGHSSRRPSAPSPTLPPHSPHLPAPHSHTRPHDSVRLSCFPGKNIILPEKQACDVGGRRGGGRQEISTQAIKTNKIF